MLSGIQKGFKDFTIYCEECVKIFNNYILKLLKFVNPFDKDNLIYKSFVPDLNKLDSKFNYIKDKLISHFPLWGTCINFFDAIGDSVVNVNGDNARIPKFSMNLKNIFGVGEDKNIEIIDFSFYTKYRVYIHSIIVLVSTFNFAMYAVKKIIVITTSQTDSSNTMEVK